MVASLGREGLGFCSLALHSPSAYLASLSTCKARSLIPSNKYALESFNIFNCIVPPVHAISGELLLHSSYAKRISQLGPV